VRKPPSDSASDVSTDQYSPRQFKNLLRLALKDVEAAGAERSTGIIDELHASLDLLCDGSGESGSDLLLAALSRSVTLDELRRIKSVSKRFLERAPAGSRRDAAKLLYHLAVARALTQFDVDISRTPLAKRRAQYLKFAQVFSAHGMGRVFLAAAQRRA